jgi:rare lipoprotein A (peptidoglycan hydrolase)
LSPRTHLTRTIAAIFAAAGTVAIAAGFAIGLAGWPPAEAKAATDLAPATLGVLAGSSVPLSTATTADKFGVTSPEQRASAYERRALHRSTRRGSSGFAQAYAKRPDRIGRITKRWRRARVSWYGPGFYGHTMAGGGKLRRTSMVVAHRSLPFGTKVQIAYKGRAVTATVRDRGPFVAGREFDLGPGTAKALHFSGVGTIRYKLIKKK